MYVYICMYIYILFPRGELVTADTVAEGKPRAAYGVWRTEWRRQPGFGVLRS